MSGDPFSVARTTPVYCKWAEGRNEISTNAAKKQEKDREDDGETGAIALESFVANLWLQGDLTGCRTGNGDKLSSSQPQPGQAIKSAVA